MKRVLFSIVGTVVGLVGLLSYKTHPVDAGAAAVPPAAGGAPATSGHLHRHTHAGSSGGKAAPEHPTRRTVQGSAVSTRYGIVQVSIVLAGKKIEQVRLDQITGVDAHSDQIH